MTATIDTAEVYEVEAPDRQRETVVPFYEYAAEAFEQVFGRRPSRNTLGKYLRDRPGYPVKKFGPYVKVPYFTQLKRQFTTVEAMRRFMEVVAELEEEEGISDADLSALRSPRRSRPRRR